MARKPLPDVSCYPWQLPYLENGTQIGTPHFKPRNQWDPFREWRHIQEIRIAELGEKTACRGQEPCLQRLEESPVGEGLDS